MNAPPTDFYSAFRGHFSGVLAWTDLDALWTLIADRAADGWYIYRPGGEVPQSTASASEVRTFLGEIGARLRREHAEDYCGIVYADSRHDPKLVKIFDPNNLGVVCGSSDNPPLPGWILSRIPPAVLPRPASRVRGRLRSLFGGGS